MRLIVIPLAALLLVGCDIEDFGPSDRYKAEFHYTLKPTERLNVENFNGEIEVEGWDQPSLEVTGTKYASTQERLDNIKIDIQTVGETTEIHTTRPSDWHGNQGARYLIRAPRKTVLDQITSSNGSVRIHDMTSDARVHTSNGPVRMENISGGVRAETSNGAIDLDSVTGQVDLKTSNGRILANEITGQCEASTSNGGVTLRFKDGPNGPTRVTTSNGAVDITMARSPKNGVRVETSNGSITLDMPGNSAVHVNAQTSERVNSEFDLKETGSIDRDKHHVEGDIGEGGPLLDLTTHNGAIHLRKSASSVN
jgi:hypothetical protein